MGKLTCSASNYCSELSLTFKTNRALCRNPDSRGGRLVCVPSDTALDAQLLIPAIKQKSPLQCQPKPGVLFQLEASANHTEVSLFSMKIRFRMEEKTPCLVLV